MSWMQLRGGSGDLAKSQVEKSLAMNPVLMSAQSWVSGKHPRDLTGAVQDCSKMRPLCPWAGSSRL